MKKIVAASLVVFFSLISTVAQAEKSAWQGLHLALGATKQAGDHDFSLSHEQWGAFELWEFPVSGTGSALEVGYRWQVGETRLTIGPTLSVMQGGLQGGLSWQHEKTGASVELRYHSEFQATAGLELGYIVSERLLVAAEAGFVASDASLTLAGAYDTYAAESSVSGYVPGRYVSLGLDYRLKNGATIGAEVGRYEFNCADSYESLRGDLSTKATVFSLEVGWQF